MTSKDAVREARLKAAASHGHLLGNSSACLISKSGQSYPAGKFWEGQTAALGELLRSPSDDVSAEATKLYAEWSERTIPGDPREVDSYRTGGLEALAAFKR